MIISAEKHIVRNTGGCFKDVGNPAMVISWHEISPSDFWDKTIFSGWNIVISRRDVTGMMGIGLGESSQNDRKFHQFSSEYWQFSRYWLPSGKHSKNFWTWLQFIVDLPICKWWFSSVFFVLPWFSHDSRFSHWMHRWWVPSSDGVSLEYRHREPKDPKSFESDERIGEFLGT